MDLESYPTMMQAVTEITKYNKKKSKARASVAVASGAVTVLSQKFDEDAEGWKTEVSFTITKDQLRTLRDEATAYATLIQAFLDEIKSL
jgi:hypothetical protein